MKDDDNRPSVECVVEAVLPKRPWTINIKVIRGSVDGGSELRCVENGKRYKILGFGLAGWRPHAAGYRIVYVECLDGALADNPLKEGVRLVGEGPPVEAEARWFGAKREVAAALEREVGAASEPVRRQVTWVEPLAQAVGRLDAAVLFVFGTSLDDSITSARRLLSVVAELGEAELARLRIYVVLREHLDLTPMREIVGRVRPGRKGQTYWFRAGELHAHVDACTEENRAQVKRLTEEVLA